MRLTLKTAAIIAALVSLLQTHSKSSTFLMKLVLLGFAAFNFRPLMELDDTAHPLPHHLLSPTTNLNALRCSTEEGTRQAGLHAVSWKIANRGSTELVESSAKRRK
jgi:hypothetical protein